MYVLHYKLEVGDVVGRSHVESELIIKEIGLQRWELVLRDDEKNLKQKIECWIIQEF